MTVELAYPSSLWIDPKPVSLKAVTLVLVSMAKPFDKRMKGRGRIALRCSAAAATHCVPFSELGEASEHGRCFPRPEPLQASSLVAHRVL